MFTGIVTGCGRLEKVRKTPAGLRFRVITRIIRPSFPLRRLKIGESVAVNGCCLTLVGRKGKSLEFDVARESLRVTTLGKLKTGDLVNLELALRLGDRLGGHLVSGHVDAIARIASIHSTPNGVTPNGVTPNGAEWTLVFPKHLGRYLSPKGSVAIDGVSLTVNKVIRRKSCFTVFLIPHTLRQTTLGGLKNGDNVNLEVDIVAKYMENFGRR